MMVPSLAGVRKRTAKPNGVDILGNHPGVPPPRSVCLISACCPLSGTILLAWQVSLPALAYLDLTAFWIPHFLFWHLNMVQSFSCFRTSHCPRDCSTYGFLHHHSPTTKSDTWEQGLGRLLQTFGNVFQNWMKQPFETKLKIIISSYSNLVSRWSY